METGEQGPTGWQSSRDGVQHREGAQPVLRVGGGGAGGGGGGGGGATGTATGDSDGAGDRLQQPNDSAGTGEMAGGDVGSARSVAPRRSRLWGLPWRALLLGAVMAAIALAGWGSRGALPAAEGAAPAGREAGAPAGQSPTDGGTQAPATAASARSDDPGQSGLATTWWETIAALDQRRADVLASGDTSAITSYAAEGSPVAREDRELLDELEDQGLRPEGLESRLVAIESELERPEGEVELQVVDSRSGYELVDRASGAIAHEVAAAPDTRWTMLLRPAREVSADDPGWRVVSVERIAAAASSR